MGAILSAVTRVAQPPDTSPPSGIGTSRLPEAIHRSPRGRPARVIAPVARPAGAHSTALDGIPMELMKKEVTAARKDQRAANITRPFERPAKPPSPHIPQPSYLRTSAF